MAKKKLLEYFKPGQYVMVVGEEVIFEVVKSLETGDKYLLKNVATLWTNVYPSGDISYFFLQVGDILTAEYTQFTKVAIVGLDYTLGITGKMILNAHLITLDTGYTLRRSVKSITRKITHFN